MKITETPTGGLKVWLSKRDTHLWASRMQFWPCSFLRGRKVFAEFDNKGDLVDAVINGGRGDQACPGEEFSACLSDHITRKYPNHPAWYPQQRPRRKGETYET